VANRLLALLIIVLAVIVGGCGNDTVDADKVESQIEQNLSSATAKIASVSCPEGVEEKEGAKFTCEAKLGGGGKALVAVTLTSDRGDATYAFKAGTVEVSDNAVEPFLEDALEARGVSEANVDCPELIKVADGGKVTCSATGSGGRRGQLTFTWSDDTGNIDNSSVVGPTS
jgi:hypothetical protein